MKMYSAKYKDVGYLIIVNMIDDENLIYPLLLVQTKMHRFDIFLFYYVQPTFYYIKNIFTNYAL